MKPRHLALGAALLVAAAFAFFGDKSPSGEVVEAAPRNAGKAQGTAAPARAGVGVSGKTVATPIVLALLPREQLMEQGGAPGTAFGVQNWTPPPPPPKPAPPPPPVAPPLPFTYLGKVLENGVWEVFLARGSETLIVRKETVVDGVYRVDAIAPPSMTMTYLPLKQVQQINIGVPE
ncbi:MAG: hypothetical protein JWP59_2662 [Massilia sp.]|nr:hypothetical protein [Massilia sp.]